MSDNKPGQAVPAPGHAHDGTDRSEHPATGQDSINEDQQMQHGSRHHTSSGDGRGELDHASMGHGGMHHMQSQATGPQKFVVGLASVLALVVALIFRG